MRLRCAAILFVGLLTLLPTATLLGQKPGDEKIVLFKDGFVVRGKVARNMTKIYDAASGKSFIIPADNGFYFVEDGARTIIFSPLQVHAVVDTNPNFKKNQILFGQNFASSPNKLPSEFQVSKVGKWNTGLERPIVITTRFGDEAYTQRMTQIAPDFVRVKTIKMDWEQYFLTSEISPDTLKSFLYYYLAKVKKIESEFDRQKIVYRFLYQAGFTSKAEQELALLKKIAGKGTKRIEEVAELQENLKKEQAANFVKELERAANLGQHDTVRKRLERFAEEKMQARVEGEAQVKVSEIKANYKTADEQVKEADRLLKIYATKVRKGYKALFTEASAAIRKELNQDTVGRLETFLSQAQVFEAALKKGKEPTQATEEFMSFAVTGWVLGNGAAEENVQEAQKLWAARNLLIEFMKSDDVGSRQKLVGQLEARKLPVDQLARALTLLPPAEPYEKLDGKQPLKIDFVSQQGQTIPYYVELPPDYRHVGRTYPVLIVLHHASESPQDSLKRWRDLAAQHGFMLMAPSWGKKAGGIYGYTEREHAAVVEGLRDLRRKFAVNSDRVFLFGCEEGGKAAYDIGLAHPDLFAGVAPMSATPAFYPFRYWSNAMYLPFYVVNGDRTGKSSFENKTIFKDWVRHNFPVLYVEYKGRTLEWYEGEPKFIMEWMSGKKRMNPMRQAGVRDVEFKTMRPGDNRFYWLGTSQLLPQFVNDPANWDKLTQPATLWGQIGRIDQVNSVTVRTHGLADVTIWLGPGMLHFNDKGEATKVRLNVNGTVAFRKVWPSAGILLEHVYQTGDRQRLYWARIDLKL